MAKKPMGRPRMHPEDKLGRRLHVAFTLDQEATIRAAARSRALGVSDWLRMVALEAANR